MKTFKKILGVCAILALCFSCSEDPISQNGFGDVTGTVVLAGDNTPLANVKITTSPVSNTVFTSEGGLFLLRDIPAGEYAIQADLDGYITSFEAANVIDGREVNVVFELVESTANNRPPEEPVLDTPEDGATDLGSSIDFIWSSTDPDDDDIFYTLEVRNTATDEILLIETEKDTMVTVENLRIGTTYVWQVEATDNVNEPVKSALRTFSTTGEGTNRFFYVRKIGGNNVIFSGTDTDEGDGNELIFNENEFQITSENSNSFRPRQNSISGKVAFLRDVGAETHLFVMDPDGTNVRQLTTDIPVAGFRQSEIDITWSRNGQRIIYPYFNQLFSINASGTGNDPIYESAPGTFITEVDVNEVNDLLAIKTNNAAGYDARIVIINPNNDSEVHVVFEEKPGAIGGIDFSIDGTKVLYVHDDSGHEVPNYRRLDSRVYEYLISDSESTEIDTAKPAGFNDLDAKYTPDEGGVIFTSGSNDQISDLDIYIVRFDDTGAREKVFTNATMPDWE